MFQSKLAYIQKVTVRFSIALQKRLNVPSSKLLVLVKTIMLEKLGSSISTLFLGKNIENTLKHLSFETCVEIFSILFSNPDIDNAHAVEFAEHCRKHKCFNWSSISTYSPEEQVILYLLFGKDQNEDFMLDISLVDFNCASKIFELCKGIEKKWQGLEHLFNAVDREKLVKIKALAGKRLLSHDNVIVKKKTQNTSQDSFRIAVVASILPPNPKSAHYSLTLSFIQTLLAGPSGSANIFFALSGETTITLFQRTIRSLDGNLDQMHKKLWKEAGGAPDNFFNGTLPCTDSYSEFKSWLDTVQPSVILFIGDAFESVFYRKQAYLEYPVAFIPMAMPNDTKGFVDGMLCKKDAFYNRMSEKYGESYMYPVGYPFVSRMDAGLQDAKPLFRTHEAQKLLLTPLRGDRLFNIFSSVLSEQELAQIHSLFSGNDKLIWVFLGDAKLKSFFAGHRLFADLVDKQIFCVDFASDFGTFVKEFDVICGVPFMTGGNQSVTFCMEQGIATMARSDSDSCGVIPPNLTYTSHDEFIDLIQRLASDDEFLLSAKRDCKNRVMGFAPNKLCGKWLEALCDISRKGQKRLMEY